MAAASPAGWGQRLAALSLLILLGGGALYLLVDRGMIDRYSYYQTHLEQQQDRLEQLERMAASREPIQQLIAGILQDRNAAAQYLPQSAPPLAAAELQQRVKAVVEAAGGTLRSTQALPPAEEGSAVKVTVSASMTGDTESLQKILYELESQTPLLFLDNLDVTARENRPRLPSGRLANYSRMQLNVQFEVSGYLRKEGG
jgi:general secretion pathway protein M